MNKTCRILTITVEYCDRMELPVALSEVIERIGPGKQHAQFETKGAKVEFVKDELLINAKTNGMKTHFFKSKL